MEERKALIVRRRSLYSPFRTSVDNPLATSILREVLNFPPNLLSKNNHLQHKSPKGHSGASELKLVFIRQSTFTGPKGHSGASELKLILLSIRSWKGPKGHSGASELKHIFAVIGNSVGPKGHSGASELKQAASANLIHQLVRKDIPGPRN